MGEIGKRIKEARIKKGWSQQDLSDEAKISIKTIQRIETNKSEGKEKTLRLIYEALGIEVVNSEKRELSKYQIVSLVFTVMIIAGSFMNWTYKFRHFHMGERVYWKFNGWNGSITFNDYDFQNWLLSLSAIAIGIISLSHAFQILKYRLKYMVLPLVVVLAYVIGLIDGESSLIRPAMIVVLTSTLFLAFNYRREGRKTIKNSQ